MPAATGASGTALPTGVQTIYNGSVWVCVTPVGAYSTTSGTTTVTAEGTSTLTGDGTAISVTLVTGTTALVTFHVNGYISSSGSQGVVGARVTGATTLGASVNAMGSNMTSGYPSAISMARIITGLTAGTNTFTLNYWNAGPTTFTLVNRNLVVQGIA